MDGRLKRLLQPASIAVIGGNAAEAVIRQCDAMGFAGSVWPVHPHRDRMAGRPCFRSVAELPGVPDATFVGVNRKAAIDVVRDLAMRGAGGAVVYAAGFSEAVDDGAEGKALQQALLEAAGDMAILGPNCYGLVNYLDGVPLWPDEHGGQHVERGVAILTQSSNVGISLSMQRRGLPLAYLLTVGNQAQVDLAALATVLLDDERVTAIGLHIEGIDDAVAFADLVYRARERHVPVVALKVGRSSSGRQMALTHTASIAGSLAASRAFLKRMGVPWVTSLPALLETLKLLHVAGPLPGHAIASLSCSGGDAALAADAAEGRDVMFRPLTTTQHDRIKATLEDIVTVSNPLDYHTFIWKDEEAMVATFSAMLACGFDITMLILDFPRTDRCRDADWARPARAWQRAVKATGARAAMVATLPENLPEARCTEAMAHGIVPLCGLDEAMMAIDAAAEIGKAWADPMPESVAPEALVDGADDVLLESDAKQVLAKHGLPLAASRIVRTTDEAVAAARAIGMPVVVKAIGNAHKTETGGVFLDLRDADAVRDAVSALGTGKPLLVEAMVTDGVAELAVGVTRDPVFGLLMTVAAGGVLVELLGDSRSVLLPATRADIRTVLANLRMAPLLAGYRGRPAADVEAAIDAIEAVARYATSHADSLVELDVNPLIVCPAGKGAVAVDALIRQRSPS